MKPCRRAGIAGAGTIVFSICGGSSIDIVARSALVALEVGVEPLVEQVAHQRAQLRDVLDAVRPLPLRAAPLLVRRRRASPGSRRQSGSTSSRGGTGTAAARRRQPRLSRQHLGHGRTNVREILPPAEGYRPEDLRPVPSSP